MRHHTDDALAAVEGYLLARGARHCDVREQQYGDAMDGTGFTGFPDLITAMIADLLHLAEATDADAANPDEANKTALETSGRAIARYLDERTDR